VNFDLSEDQALLKAATERFAQAHYGGDVARRRVYRSETTGFSAANWQALADLGVMALPFAAADNGLGGGAIELITVFEALGRGLVVEPILDAIIVAGGLLDCAGTPEQRGQWLPGIITGTARLALAHAETAARYNLAFVETTAEPRGDGIVLTGRKDFVVAGSGADAFIVSARGGDGIGFYLVPAGAAGLERRDYRIVDGGVASDLVLHDVRLPTSVKLRGGLEALDAVVANASLAVAAETIGLMALLLDTTVDYVKTRHQFGQALSKFQVIQHRLADAYSAAEQARSMVYRAALAAPDMRAAAGAKAFVAEAGLIVGHTAIQLHGGMGMTDELLVGHAHKRIVMLSHIFGDSAAALDRYLQAA